MSVIKRAISRPRSRNPSVETLLVIEHVALADCSLKICLRACFKSTAGLARAEVVSEPFWFLDLSRPVGQSTWSRLATLISILLAHRSSAAMNWPENKDLVLSKSHTLFDIQRPVWSCAEGCRRGWQSQSPHADCVQFYTY